MIILMHTDASPAQVEAVIEAISARGLRPVTLPGGDHTAVGVASAIEPEERQGLANHLMALPGVANVVHVSRPYKLASREFHTASSLARVGRLAFGGSDCVVIAGPCAVESREQILAAARAVKEAGATLLRGGAFKPRTSPYSFQGLQRVGLELLREAREEVGIGTVTEVIDPHDVEPVTGYVDMLQIGARNMQNYPLLIAAGRSGHPVLLKRGPGATLDEFLFAAEYVLNQGNENVVLCERGVHPLDRTYMRNTLDLNAVPILKEITHLPVIVDPSHGIGNARYVGAMSLAAVAAGADGLIVEVHPSPREALSDGQQSLSPEAFARLMSSLRRVAAAVDRGVAAPLP
ncbi:MAG: 3-deoxy-7-phosphoheptulonate synthase [Chthonomonadales bacterium]|nr:3-deoxy-7-phosphoheptulonate synthase [Chthonomonadales bacterium]